MKKVIFIHNITGKEIVVKCDTVGNKNIGENIFYLCTVNIDNEDREVGIFSFTHYSMYERKSFKK